MNERKTILDHIQGIEPVDKKAMERFDREMSDTVIPKIVRDAEENAILAAESRLREMEIQFDRRKKG